jgi:hypothetical protein
VSWHPTTGFSHVAGTGTAGPSGDQGPAINAQLSNPSSVALTPGGHVLVADTNNYSLRKVWSP